MKKDSLNTWIKSGTPWVWMNAGAVSIAVIMTLGLLAVIAVRGLEHFWPADVIVADYQVPGSEPRLVAGEVVQAEEVPRARLAASGLPVNVEGGEFMTRELLKVGNRDVYGADFSWVIGEWLSQSRKPADLVVLERREWGNFYGELLNIKESGRLIAQGADAWGELQQRIDRVDDLYAQIARLEKVDIGHINHGLERLRLKTRKLELDDELDANAQAELDAERARWDADYQALEGRLRALHSDFNRDSITMRTMDGQQREFSLGKIVRAYRPNAMSLPDKIGFYFAKVWEFVSDEPREANTEGGIFPAIFGTVLMTLIMAVIVTPFGVIAAVYLREYAKQGVLTRIIRIAVNNLAGVPSIVYGVFGLGFFVYVLGGSLDRIFYPEAAPAPVFGTPGLMWASDSARRLAGARCDQVRNAMEGSATDGQPGHDDRPDSRGGACRRRSRSADAGGRGQAGADPATQRQLPLPAPRSEDHAPGLPHL